MLIIRILYVIGCSSLLPVSNSYGTIEWESTPNAGYARLMAYIKRRTSYVPRTLPAIEPLVTP